MDNFLTNLYFEKFENTQEEKRLMGLHDFDSESSAHRNDEKISGCRKTGRLIDKLIDTYMNKNL